MSVPGSYIGKPVIKVTLLGGSPFNGVPDQEWSYYFVRDNIKSLSKVQNIFCLPPPWNGVRCTEDPHNYDNFLVDTKGKKLEEAVKKDGTGLIDTLADRRVKILLQQRKDRKDDSSATQDDFFTWQTCENFFKTSDENPSPIPFENMLDDNTNAPKWTYVNKTKPDGKNPAPLTPFMTLMPNSQTKGVHWGCKMKSALAINQPFEILYYHNGQVHGVAAEAKPLVPKIAGIIAKDKLNIDISKRAYLAVEFGINTTDNYLILMVQGISPRIYALGGTGENRGAKLISEFTEFNGDKLFNPDNTFVTLKVEPVGFGLLITSNSFDGKEWVVNGGDPVLVGSGPVGIYSGNIQAGFTIRPIQYLPAKFTTSSEEITQQSNDNRKPSVTTGMKGTGTNVSSVSTNPNSGASELSAADAESINGEKIMTFISKNPKEKPGAGVDRKIKIKLITIPDESGQGPAIGSSSGGGGTKESTYAVEVELTPSDVSQGNGFLVKNGRSPYLWQIRCYLPQTDNGGGSQSGKGTDITCDVLSCDLTWNATSFTEFAHNGTLRVQNKPRSGGTDLRGYTNRAVYLKIEGYWQNGVGVQLATKLFTGMTVGSSVENTVGREIVQFQLDDYMNVLEGVKFVLSPFYDGMKASKAVRAIVRQAGLSDSTITSGGSSISGAPDDPTEYGLPFTNPFEHPQFRFASGSSLKAAVLKIAELDLRTVFFDAEGKFHYDPIPGGIFNDEDTSSQLDFVSSPRDTGDPTLIVWNMASFGRQINDVYNIFKVSTVDKESGAQINLGATNPSSIFSPGTEGYLGFPKYFVINEAAIGSVEAAGKYLDTYRSRLLKPPITFKFETYGRGDIKPLDIITLDGQKARVMNISMHADAKEQQWWMNVECEWFDGGQKADSPDITNPGGNPDL